MTTLSVVIPAYNEENGIEEIARRVLAVEPALKEVGVNELELIVVDDGSSDRTGEIAGSIEGVRLITQKNKGYGGALKTGFSNAKGELIGFLDADGTYPPEYFPQLAKRAKCLLPAVWGTSSLPTCFRSSAVKESATVPAASVFSSVKSTNACCHFPTV